MINMGRTHGSVIGAINCGETKVKLKMHNMEVVSTLNRTTKG